MATKWQSTESFFVPQAIDETSTKQQNPEGSIVSARDIGTTDYGTGQFIYLKGVASTAVGDYVTYDQKTFATTRPTAATTVGSYANAMSANVADQWGWYQIQGQVTAGLTVVGATTGKPLYPFTTAGALKISGTAAYQILGAITNGAISGSGPYYIDAYLTYPIGQGIAI